MKDRVGFTNKVLEIIEPVGMYYLTITLGMFVAQFFFGASNESYMLCKIIGSLVALPVVCLYYIADLKRIGQYGKKWPFSMQMLKNILLVTVITICISVSLNNIISMSPLVTVSDEYDKASNAFYGSTIWLELLGSAVITPLLEEVLHRGVVYIRLRRSMNMWPAVIVSAFVFAALHFNVVQFTYAFLLGIVFALFTEKTGHIYPAVLAHIVANGIAVIRTETGFLSSTVDGTVSAWLISVGLLLIGLGILIIYVGKKESKKWQ